MGDLCPHDLHPAACLSCRSPRLSRPAKATLGPAFIARFEGECPGCPADILIGEEVRRVGGNYWHARCAVSRVD